MIEFKNMDVWGFEGAIRGMRNPLNSWDKSDSGVCGTAVGRKNYIIGQKDMELCQRLIKGGPEHCKFLRQIMVSVDITAPLYWWKEFDTYKVGTVANSCSTMHTIHKKPFELDDFSCDKLIAWDPEKPDDEDQEFPIINVGDNYLNHIPFPIDTLTDVINSLNYIRRRYLETNDKKYWYNLIQLLPSSYNQTRTVTMSYANLRSMYFQRRNHKLDEWKYGFCTFVETLPYAKELIIFEPEKKPEVKLDEKVLAKALMPAT